MFRPRLLPLSIALALAVPMTAQADPTLTAFSTATAGSVNQTDGWTGPLFGVGDHVYSSSWADDSPDHANADAWGNADGVSGARAEGDGTYSSLGRFSSVQTVTNNFAGPAGVSYDFLIYGGNIWVALASAYDDDWNPILAPLADGESVSSGYTVSVLVNNTVAWTSQAVLTLSGPTPETVALTKTGADLNSGLSDPDSWSDGYWEYYWNSFEGSLDLGLLDPGEELLLEYRLEVFAEGNVGVYAFGGGSGYGYGGGFCGGGFFVSEVGSGGDDSAAACSGGRIGDPFNLGLDPFGPTGVTLTQVAGVPEPGSLGLLAAGLGALAWLRRRRVY